MEIRKTDDGSNTIWADQYQETYHSTKGAITESNHVFIEAGFNHSSGPVNIFEVGFGSGLNALLTLIASEASQRQTIYHSVELNPVPIELAIQLQYPEQTEIQYRDKFEAMHHSSWDCAVKISPFFTLHKISGNLLFLESEINYDIVYFDAFSPNTQPELWKEEIFNKIYQLLKPGGILTTYCAKGDVRRTMKSVGFKTERLPGPPGKWEMLRATKKI